MEQIPGRFARYQLEALLGEGAMARVYRAYDPATDQRIALKILKEAWREDRQFVERFLREARAAGPLKHPGIVSINTVEETPAPFINMELIEGRSLAQVLAAEGRMRPADAARIACELAEALAAAHALGRVHRDIKPSNILLAEPGRRAKLADFGIAVIDRPDATQLTQHGEMVGTPRYMAPEQVRGEHTDARSDLFSLGATFYEMLTGVRAFPGETLVSVATQILNNQPRPLHELAGDVPGDLVAIVGRLLEKDPSRRFASAAELVAALRRWEAGGRADSEVAVGGGYRPPDGGTGTNSRPPARNGPRPRRSAIPIAAGAGAALALTGLVVWLLLGNTPPVALPDRAETLAGEPVRIAVLANDGDSDPGDALALIEATLEPGSPGEVTIERDALVYDPGDAFAGLAQGDSRTVGLRYKVRDGAGDEAKGTVEVLVRGREPRPPPPPPPPSPPIAVLDSAQTLAGTPVSIAVLANDRDPDPGDVLSLVEATVEPGSPGRVALDGDALVYDPGDAFSGLAEGESRTVELRYKVRDRAGAEAEGRVEVLVRGIWARPPPPPPPPPENRPPIAAPDAVEVAADRSVLITPLANDLDPDADDILALADARLVPGALGRLTIQGDALLYEPAGAFADLPRGGQRPVDLRYTVRDSRGAATEGRIVVTVIGTMLKPREASIQLISDTLQLPCGWLEAEPGSGPLRLHGVVADAAAREQLLQRIGGLSSVAAATVSVLPADSGSCRALDALSDAVLPAPRRLVSLEATPDCPSCNREVKAFRLSDGDRLVLRAEIPADRPFLTIDYVMADDNVYHAFPPPTLNTDQVDGASYTTPWPFGHEVWIGDKREPAFPRTLPIGAPFGREMIVAVASKTPLFRATRPSTEPLAGYLRDLKAALAQVVSADGRRPLASVVSFETAAR